MDLYFQSYVMNAVDSKEQVPIKRGGHHMSHGVTVELKVKGWRCWKSLVTRKVLLSCTVYLCFFFLVHQLVDWIFQRFVHLIKVP